MIFVFALFSFSHYTFHILLCFFIYNQILYIEHDFFSLHLKKKNLIDVDYFPNQPRYPLKIFSRLGHGHVLFTNLHLFSEAHVIFHY